MGAYVLVSFVCSVLVFFFNDTATTEIYTLSLHDALPICAGGGVPHAPARRRAPHPEPRPAPRHRSGLPPGGGGHVPRVAPAGGVREGGAQGGVLRPAPRPALGDSRGGIRGG